jgi:hypothetical protein
MKSTYCEYILEKILSTSEVGPIEIFKNLHNFDVRGYIIQETIIKAKAENIL